jgi:hypothetical protein
MSDKDLQLEKKIVLLEKKLFQLPVLQLDNEIPNNQKLLGYGNDRK